MRPLPLGLLAAASGCLALACWASLGAEDRLRRGTIMKLAAWPLAALGVAGAAACIGLGGLALAAL